MKWLRTSGISPPAGIARGSSDPPRSAARGFLFFLRGALFLQCLGRFLFLFFLSVHTFTHDSLLGVVRPVDHHFFGLRVLNILRGGGRPACRPLLSRGGFGGFSLTRLMRISRPATRTFCKSLNICFGMPSGKSTKL